MDVRVYRLGDDDPDAGTGTGTGTDAGVGVGTGTGTDADAGATPPEVAVVAGIHGDEPCGVRAVERLLAEAPTVARPARLVVANEAALARGDRFVDADLNRPVADVPDDAHEADLARRLADALRGCTVLSLHSTRSSDDPFAVVGDASSPAAALAPALPVVALAEFPPGDERRPFAVEADVLDVEAGRQGTEAAVDNAERVTRAFLAATGVLPGDGAVAPVPRPVPVFRRTGRLPKPPAETYAVRASNFERVAAGETYATADGEPVVADEPFSPILLSADGYPDVFGFAGERAGRLDPSAVPDSAPRPAVEGDGAVAGGPEPSRDREPSGASPAE